MIRRESSMTSCCCKEYYEKPRNKIVVQFVLSVRGRKGWHTDTQPNPQSPKLSAEGPILPPVLANWAELYI